MHAEAYTLAMIAITPAAAVHLRALLTAHEGAPSDMCNDTATDTAETAAKFAPEGLRILVEKGGCAGMQYAMKLDIRQNDDLLSEVDGAQVFMDPASAAMLRGAELDYCDDLVGTGFRLQNPNATRSCGCGTSFEPAQPTDGGSTQHVEHAADYAP
jgi:iron-sulfur cluster assembly accessory protein